MIYMLTTRVWSHTTLLTVFCDNIDLYPVDKHVSREIDYKYQFNMLRFNTLDNFIVSGNLFATAVNNPRMTL